MPNKYIKGCWPWQLTPNPLNTHDTLGSTKPVVNPLPQDSFAYGDMVPIDQYNCKDVIYTSLQNKPSKDYSHKLDTRALNKACITNNLSLAPQFYAYRKSQNKRKPIDKGSLHIPITIPQQSHVYGAKIVPQLTKLILTNSYAQAQQEQNKTKYCKQFVNKSNNNSKLSFYKTLSHRLVWKTNRNRINQFGSVGSIDKTDYQWKMNKFLGKAKSKIKDGVQQHRKRYLSQRRTQNKQKRGCAFP